VGTTLSVRDLFYNVPARRKFLRSSNTEAGHVTEVLVDAALSRPDVAFSLTRDGRKTKTFPRVRSRLERVRQVLSEEELGRCAGQKGPLEVEAFLAGPERGRKGAGGLKLFVNGRPVRDRALAATIAHSYGDSLERGRYPRGVVYLALPGRLVDVNVHPQKTEVRFADPRAVADAVHGIIKRQLLSNEVLRQPKAAGARSEAAPPEASAPARRISAPPPRLLHEGSKAVGGQRYAPAVGLDRPPPRGPAVVRGTFKNLRLLGQMNASYLVCEGDDGLYVLDQHAAHERILFTELERAYATSRVPSQALLFPVVLHLSPAELEVAVERADVLARFGLDVRPRAEGAVSVHSVPQILGRAGPGDLLRHICSVLGSSKGGDIDARLVLARVACAEAVKPGERLQRETGDALLRSLALADFDLPCRHGKVVVSVTLSSDLESKAGRKK
jgi:DNA mismatch repair protein MutL